ncbi:decaprenyl-phosphate phosphoribosyltransferase [bacterium]|nr:decaprenyl-phosphate phosphoribosyltransferase [bacterium]
MKKEPRTPSTTSERTVRERTARPVRSPANSIRGLIKTMRIKQWTKNSFVLAPLVFDGKLFEFVMLERVLVAFFCFCLASSSVYLLNDLVDIEKDRQHPRKRLRPLASGQLSPTLAGIMALAFAVISVVAMGIVDLWAGAVVGVYLIQNLAYSFYLKNIVLIDVMTIAAGFVLRVVAGVLVVDVQNFSPWLYVCVTLVALFMGFGKRRHEIALLEADAGTHRASLEHYNLPFLDQIIGLVTTSALVSYTLYSFEAETSLARDGKMLFTVPFVFYGILRYLYLIHVRKLGGAPEDLILQDKPFLIAIILWVVALVVVIYT